MQGWLNVAWKLLCSGAVRASFLVQLMTVYVQAAWEKQCSWELMSTPLLALTQTDRWKGQECLYWYPKFFQQAVPALARVADREDER